MNLRKKWKICLIHHSHTDVGYTDRQEKIEKYHVEFIKQAIEIGERSRSGSVEEGAKGFRWTCETFWAVERFLEATGPDWHRRLEEALRLGDLELSAAYLNMTELIDYDVLRSMTSRAPAYAKSIGLKLDSAMTADINGYAWGYADCLTELGIRNLFSCVHTYHGMFPLGRVQTPFWWETQKGDRLLVWNGDHYHLGNVLGLMPGANVNYLFQDEFENNPVVSNQWERTETRLHRYLAKLEEEQYPYDFVPVMVSGLITDNGPPNGKLAEHIRQWNEAHGSRIELEMTGLGGFFETLRGQTAEIPVYRGDWPDWWADGVASTAMHTSIFRDAQRTLRKVKALDPEHKVIGAERWREAEYQLAMFAEHTWGYWSSVIEPWHPMVQSLGVRKEAYAAQAHRIAYSALDDILQERGEAPLSADRGMTYKAINPFPYPVRESIRLDFDFWELPLIKKGVEVREEGKSEAPGHQLVTSVRGTSAYIPIALEPGEEREFRILPVDRVKPSTASGFRTVGADSVDDIAPDGTDNSGNAEGGVRITANAIESPYVKIAWKPGEGIASWTDKASGKEMLRAERSYPAFTPIYEKTPVSEPSQMASTRTRLGRNRKGTNAERSAGKLSKAVEIASGAHIGIVELHYEMKGASYYVVSLTVHAALARVDVAVRIHKDSIWEPENVYVALPFGEGYGADQLWIEKTGTLMRPRVDQLPGTGIDFYCVQEGIAYVSDASSLSIAMPDSPLIHLGALAHHPIRLHGNASEDQENAELYSWILNNFWDTNFKASIGGFYEFRYGVSWTNEPVTEHKAMQACHAMNNGILTMRSQ